MKPFHSPVENQKIYRIPKVGAPQPETAKPASQGMSKPFALLPIKNRVFEYLPTAQSSARRFIENLKDEASQANLAFDELLNWTGLERMPLSTMAPVVAVSGSTVLATGIAKSLLNPGQKVAILEWGHSESSIAALLSPEAPHYGLAEVFNRTCDLTPVILNAKLYSQLPRVFAIGQGSTISRNEMLAHLPELSQLIAALSKKFHRIVISLPSHAENPRLFEILSGLNLNYGLFYDPEHRLLSQAARIKQIWPNGIVQRLS